jgi:hypothetical protein
MDARATVERSGISKSGVAFVLGIAAALLLGGAGGYAVKGLSPQADGGHKTPAVAPQTSISGWDSYRSERGGVQLGDLGGTVEYTLGAVPTRPGGPRS